MLELQLHCEHNAEGKVRSGVTWESSWHQPRTLNKAREHLEAKVEPRMSKSFCILLRSRFTGGETEPCNARGAVQ